MASPGNLTLTTMFRHSEMSDLSKRLREYFDWGMDTPNDLGMEAADRLDAQDEVIRELVGALKLLHDDCMNYSRINKLGGENNQVLVNARAVLSSLEAK